MGGDSMASATGMSRKGPLPKGSLSGSAAYGGKSSKNNQQAYGSTYYCGLNLVLLKFNTLENPGRLFFRCPLYKKPKLSCKYFEWADEVEDDREDNGTVEEISARNNVDGVRQANMTEAKMKVLMRMMSKMKGDVKRLEVLLFLICLGVGVCVILNLCTLFK